MRVRSVKVQVEPFDRLTALAHCGGDPALSCWSVGRYSGVHYTEPCGCKVLVVGG